MNKWEVGFNIFEALTKIVPFVESWFSDSPKSGKDKKKLAMESFKSIVKASDSIATGGAKDTWSKIEQHAPKLIDMTAKMMYPSDNVDMINK